MKKKTILPLYFSRISYLSFGSEMAKCSRQSLQPCKFLTGNNTRWTIDQVYRLHCFLPGEDIRSYDQLIKITRACIKFIGSRSIQESFRFPTKQYFYFGGSYHLYAAYCILHIPNSAGENGFKETMSEKRHKISEFANYQNITVRPRPLYFCSFSKLIFVF